MAQIADHADHAVNKVLVGNKCDSTASRRVSSDEGAKLAAEYGVRFIEASAKTNVNVTEAFKLIAQQVVQRIPDQRNERTHRLRADAAGGKKACC